MRVGGGLTAAAHRVDHLHGVLVPAAAGRAQRAARAAACARPGREARAGCLGGAVLPGSETAIFGC
jgi:hypothetical protein